MKDAFKKQIFKIMYATKDFSLNGKFLMHNLNIFIIDRSTTTYSVVPNKRRGQNSRGGWAKF